MLSFLGQQLCYGVYGLSLLLGVLFLTIPEDQTNYFLYKQVIPRESVDLPSFGVGKDYREEILLVEYTKEEKRGELGERGIRHQVCMGVSRRRDHTNPLCHTKATGVITST